MKVGVIQSSFIPWRGFFDFISSVDLFVFYDDIQYSKGSWRNRNRIKTVRGLDWLTVPIKNKKLSQLICETRINYSIPWFTKHVRVLELNYREAPFLSDILNIFSKIEAQPFNTISELNIYLISEICLYLDISTPTINSAELNLKGSKTDRLIELMTKVKGSTYLSGPSADNYLDKQAFINAGISLEYKTYDYRPYPQLWGEFEGAVTILDIIANCGPDAKNYIHSSSPNQIIFN